jgi:hypothetical protein
VRSGPGAEVLEAQCAKSNARKEHRDAGDALNDAKQDLEDWKEGRQAPHRG